jgi:hypothetical protein
MRQLLLTCIATGLCAVTSYGTTIDFKNVTNGVWNTGIVSNAALVTPGEFDPHYVLIPPASCTSGNIQCQEAANDLFGPRSYVVLGPNGTYPVNGAWPYGHDTSAGANSTQWIGPRPNQVTPIVGGGPGFNNVNPFASATEFYVYRVNFNLNMLGLTSGTYSIQLKWLSDNPNNTDSSQAPLPPQQLSHIDVCNTTGLNDAGAGTGCSTVATGNPGQTAAAFGSTVTINGAVASGWQSLDFIVFNSVVPNQDANPTGLRVQIVSATASDVPEPATFGLIAVALLGLGAYSRRKQ